MFQHFKASYDQDKSIPNITFFVYKISHNTSPVYNIQGYGFSMQDLIQ